MAAIPANPILIYNPHNTQEIWITDRIFKRHIGAEEYSIYQNAGMGGVETWPASFFDGLPVAG